MAILRLTFKDKTIQVHHIDAGDTLIGRDPDCSIIIDSLAIAPQHARITGRPGNYAVIALNEEFPVLLNKKPVTEHRLSHGDILQLGKHTLSFTEATEAITPDTQPGNIFSPTLPAQPEETEGTSSILGYVQMLNGKNIGRIVPLKRGLIRFGESESTCAIIARREDGYHLSHLEGETRTRVNGDPIGDQSHLLHDGDIIEIGPTQLQFHAESR